MRTNTDADRELLKAILDERDPMNVNRLIYHYWHDLDRAERTSRGILYLHLGILQGHLMRFTEKQ